MQIQTPAPVGGEITPNGQQSDKPPVNNGVQIPVTPDAGVAPAVEDGGGLGENPSIQETLTPGTETTQSVDPVVAAAAEAAGLEGARQAVESGADGSVKQAAPEPAGQDVTDVVQDREAVSGVLNPGTGDPAATAKTLEDTVAGNHLETPDASQEVAADGNIGQVAATDQAGPEPVPAPPAAASVITSQTPDNLTAGETQVPATPGGETSPPPPPSSPPLPDLASAPVPEGSFVNTAGMPLPPQTPQTPPQAGAQMGSGEQTLTSTEKVSEAMRQVDRAYGDPNERPTSPDATMARRMIEGAMDDVEAAKTRLKELLRAYQVAPGSEEGEAKTGEA